MYKVLFVAMIAISSVGFTSCGTYQSAASKSTVSSSMLGKIGTILIQDLTNSVLSKAGMGDIAGKLNMATKLNTIIKGASMVSSFKNMLSGNYGIAASKVDKAYNSFGDLKDVATFVGQNASKSFLSKL